MANTADIYVEVDKMTSEKTDADPKFQKDVPAIMLKTVCDVIAKMKGVTTSPPKEKHATGYAIEGALTKLSKETKGNDDIYSCVVTMSLTEWPKSFMVGRFHGKTKSTSQAGLPEKKARKEAEACVKDATILAVNDALAEMNKRGAPVAVS